MKPPRIRLLGYVTGLAVYLVDGERVRNELDIDFTCGGNEAVYPNYVPKGEIWIDDVLGPLDQTATILHEIVERNLMLGKGWSYERAHDAASSRERPFRSILKRAQTKRLDLARVRAALATNIPKTAGKRHSREYPRTRAVGRQRKRRKVERDIERLVTPIMAR